MSRAWFNFAHERMERNLASLDRLMTSRTPQDLAALQSEILRDNFEGLVEYAKKVASQSTHVAEETSRRFSETVERGLHAA
jgi:phasin family protein